MAHKTLQDLDRELFEAGLLRGVVEQLTLAGVAVKIRSLLEDHDGPGEFDMGARAALEAALSTLYDNLGEDSEGGL